MKKEDLKTGMIIENKRGQKSMVLLGTKDGDIHASSSNWGTLKSYDDELKYEYPRFVAEKLMDSADIVKVYQPVNNMEYGKQEILKLIWERKEEIEMTMEEICEALGKTVKIVKEKI